jgi:hypothetical protein
VNARLLAELRPVGFAVAYRMLGSVSEAEDIVQEAFLRLHHTLQDGDLGALEELLAHDVTLHGGGLPQPLKGRVRVARTLLAGLRTATTRLGRVSLREVTVNGQPGAMVLDPSERLIGVVALDIAEGGQIQTVTSVINPDKLRHLGPLADLGPLGGRGRRGGAERGPAGPPA